MSVDPTVRFSRGWWLVITAATVVVGLAAYLFLRFGAAMESGRLVIFMLAIIGFGDVFVAMAMEGIAPTRVTIGPGERRFASDPVAEKAVVVAAFDDAGTGQVRVRGETWCARRAATDGSILDVGDPVWIVDRDGLTLIVGASAS